MNWKHRQYSIFILPSAGTCGRKKDVHRIYNSLSYHPLSNAPVRYESSHSCPFLTCCCWYICGLSHSCSYFHWIYGLVTLCFRSIHTSSQRWTVSALQQPLLHQQPTAQHSTAQHGAATHPSLPRLCAGLAGCCPVSWWSCGWLGRHLLFCSSSEQTAIRHCHLMMALGWNYFMKIKPKSIHFFKHLIEAKIWHLEKQLS